MEIGVDIVEIKRIEKVCKRKTFLERFFTQRELDTISRKKNPYPHIAGKYAAKEAVSKALGTGFRYFKWHDIEILNDPMGKPQVVLSGKALEIFNANGLNKMNISISHSREYALAFAVAVIVTDIGMPRGLIEKPNAQGKVIDSSYISTFFRTYPSDVHKGSFGRVFIIAGSQGMTGAAALSGLSAVRSGAGLVTVGVPQSLNDILEVKLIEAMTLPLPETDDRCLSKEALEKAVVFSQKSDVVVLGPGLSVKEGTKQFVRQFVSSCKIPMVIDADGLNTLSETPKILEDAQGPVIITPHTGEMARLLSASIHEIKNNRVYAVKAAAKKFNCIAVLKGARTLISDNNGRLWINPTGNPGMATGGSGDVLSGMIGGFLARGMKAYEAALTGVYVHGLAGDLAALEKGEVSLIASDIIDFVPAAIKQVVFKEMEM